MSLVPFVSMPVLSEVEGLVSEGGDGLDLLLERSGGGYVAVEGGAVAEGGADDVAVVEHDALESVVVHYAVFAQAHLAEARQKVVQAGMVGAVAQLNVGIESYHNYRFWFC